jgi:hypothetical protein
MLTQWFLQLSVSVATFPAVLLPSNSILPDYLDTFFDGFTLYLAKLVNDLPLVGDLALLVGVAATIMLTWQLVELFFTLFKMVRG